MKTTCGKSIHLAGTPQLGKCRGNGRPSETGRNSTKSAKSARGQTSEDRESGRNEANRLHHEPEQQPNGADETARRDNTKWKDTAPSPGGDEEHHEPVACNNEHTKDKRKQPPSPCRKYTRGYCTTLVLAAPSLPRVGYIASCNRVASEQVLRMTRADSPWAGHRHRQQTCCATGVVAGADFISIAPLRGASARNCLRHLHLPTCGREGEPQGEHLLRRPTPQPQSRDKDAFLRPVLSRASWIPPPYE